MSTIALNRLTTEIPTRWQHLPLTAVRHFDWASTNLTTPCGRCNTPLKEHLWRVRAADGTIRDCGATS